MSESEEEEDLQAETARLQKIRSAKLARQAAKQIQDSDDELIINQTTANDHQQDVQMDDDDSDSSDQSNDPTTQKKLGDKLFADSESSENDEDDYQAKKSSKRLNLTKLAQKMDSNLLKQVIEKDSPEL